MWQRVGHEASILRRRCFAFVLRLENQANQKFLAWAHLVLTNIFATLSEAPFREGIEGFPLVLVAVPAIMRGNGSAAPKLEHVAAEHGDRLFFKNSQHS
jgi:hypothetical protein